MEPALGAIENLEPGALLHCEVHKHGFVLELCIKGNVNNVVTSCLCLPEKLLNAMNL